MNRRLYRCRNDRRLGGVAAGLAEFFDLDPTLVRVLWFLSIFFGGISLLLYFGLWIIVPLEPLSAEEAAAQSATEPAAHRHGSRGSGRWSLWVGIVLILFGALAFANALLPGLMSWRYLWPAFLIGLGAVLIAGAVRREPTEL